TPSYTKSVSWQHHRKDLLNPTKGLCLLQLIATILMLIIFYRGFPATSRGAVRPHKNKVGYSGWE
ncbi:hypothetical protein, partial [Escherichia coli]|uniref:hypothetical protein n=1 Tax=Escherichia coli TaxID=562 RepID=UPI000D6E4830